MAAERRTAAQAEQQQVVLDCVAGGGCDVRCGGAGGDTRLGNDAAKMNRMARGVMGRISDEQRRRDSAGPSEEQCAVAMAQRRKVGKLQWDSAGSHSSQGRERDLARRRRGGFVRRGGGSNVGADFRLPWVGKVHGKYIHGQRWETADALATASASSPATTSSLTAPSRPARSFSCLQMLRSST